jgi:hypothetical protein
VSEPPFYPWPLASTALEKPGPFLPTWTAGVPWALLRRPREVIVHREKESTETVERAVSL